MMTSASLARIECSLCQSIHFNTSLVTKALSWSHGWLGSCQITLTKQSHFVRLERSNHRVQYTPIVEQNHVPFLPVMCIHILRAYGRTLELVHNITDACQVIDHGAVGAVNASDGRGVNLKCQFASHWILPGHREDHDFLLVDWRELGFW